MAEPRIDRAREVVAGVTTFFAMSYIAVVNPQILSGELTGLAFSGVLTATVLVASVGSVSMGVVARLPYAVAPGMGLNAFFTYTLVLEEGLSGPQALGAVTLSGAIFLLLSVTPIRVYVARGFPVSLRRAAAVGIGLFLSFIALKESGFVAKSDATLVRFGGLTPSVWLFVGGLLLTALLNQFRVKGALLIGIAAVTVASLVLGYGRVPSELFAAPDFSLLFAFSFDGIWTVALIGPVLTLLLTDLLDSISTLLGVSSAAGLVDEEGHPLRLERALWVDAIASLVAGAVGSSPGTTYIESAAGVQEGGRTGLTAIVAGLCFVPLMFFSPVAEMVPRVATAPALFMVGFFMLGAIRELPERAIEAIPAFMTMVIIPLTYSITEGIVWGVIAHVTLHVFAGRAGEISRALWGIGLACALVNAVRLF